MEAGSEGDWAVGNDRQQVICRRLRVIPMCTDATDVHWSFGTLVENQQEILE